MHITASVKASKKIDYSIKYDYTLPGHYRSIRMSREWPCEEMTLQAVTEMSTMAQMWRGLANCSRYVQRRPEKPGRHRSTDVCIGQTAMTTNEDVSECAGRSNSPARRCRFMKAFISQNSKLILDPFQGLQSVLLVWSNQAGRRDVTEDCGSRSPKADRQCTKKYRALTDPCDMPHQINAVSDVDGFS